MIDQDYNRFASVWKDLNGLYNKFPSSEVISMAFKALAHYPIDQVIAACQVYAQFKKFPPVPADITSILEGKMDEKSEVQLQNEIAIRALDQWRAVLDACGSYGRSCQYLLEDIHTRYALEVIGGISAVCQADYNSLQFIRKDFLNAYKAYSARSGRIPPEVFNENGDNALVYISKTANVTTGSVNALPKKDAVIDENKGQLDGIFENKTPEQILNEIMSHL